MSQIGVRSGEMLNLLSPDLDKIHIEDIAYALSGLNRYTGHSRFTVAQHSLMVAHLVPWRYKLEALLHDAQEAYVGDVSKPLKELCPEHQRIEKLWETAIRMKFGLPTEKSDVVHAADMRVLELELLFLFSREVKIPGAKASNEKDEAEIEHRLLCAPFAPKWAEKKFLELFLDLTAGRDTF